MLIHARFKASVLLCRRVIQGGYKRRTIAAMPCCPSMWQKLTSECKRPCGRDFVNQQVAVLVFETTEIHSLKLIAHGTLLLSARSV